MNSVIEYNTIIQLLYKMTFLGNKSSFLFKKLNSFIFCCEMSCIIRFISFKIFLRHSPINITSFSFIFLLL